MTGSSWSRWAPGIRQPRAQARPGSPGQVAQGRRAPQRHRQGRAASGQGRRAQGLTVKELVLYVARALADEPDAVKVEVREGPTTVYELSVAPQDLGKVIGRQGRTAKALRTLVAAAAEEKGQRATLDSWIDLHPRGGGGQAPRPSRRDRRHSRRPQRTHAARARARSGGWGEARRRTGAHRKAGADRAGSRPHHHRGGRGAARAGGGGGRGRAAAARGLGVQAEGFWWA